MSKKKPIQDVSEKDWRSILGLNNKESRGVRKRRILGLKSLASSRIEKIGDSGSESRDTLIETDSDSECRDALIEKKKLMMKPQETLKFFKERLGFFVATNDTRFSQQHKENLLLPIVSVEKGSFGIKNLSKKKRRHAPEVDSVCEPAIIDDSPLPYDSPVYKRLMARLELYQFTQIPVNGDGNCMQRALSEQLTHSQKRYAEVRKLIVEQLKSNQELYEQKVKNLKPDPEHMDETYLDYVNRKSKDKVWGDPVNLQAASDRRLGGKSKAVARSRLWPKLLLMKMKKSNKTRFRAKKKLVNKETTTLKFYKDHLGFDKDADIFLDGSFIFHCFIHEIDIKDHIKNTFESMELGIVTTDCAWSEFQCYLNQFTENSKIYELPVFDCEHKDKLHAQDCIMSLVGRNNKNRAFIASHDHNFLQELTQNNLIPVVVIERGGFVLKCLSKKQRRELRISKIETASEDDPHEKRLMDRMNLYNFAPIKVEGDGNCALRALSEQLTHSQDNHAKVRMLLYNQFRLNEKLYAEEVKMHMDLSRGIYGRHPTYSNFLEKFSKDTAEVPFVTIQAAADFFKAKIVCICSDKESVFKEYNPHDMGDPERVLYLSLLFGEDGHADSVYPQSTPSKSCHHLIDLDALSDDTVIEKRGDNDSDSGDTVIEKRGDNDSDSGDTVIEKRGDNDSDSGDTVIEKRGCRKLRDSLDKPIQLAKRVKLERCLHETEITAEKCIRTIVGIHNSQKMFVATRVNRCWPLVDKNPLIPIITVKNGGFVLKELSEDMRWRAKNWSPTFPIEKPAFTDTELKETPDYKRLLKRFAFYGFDGEITVDDTESQFKAISEQLGPLEWPYKVVKGSVVDQLLLHSERYMECHIDYIVAVSRAGEYGDEVTLQAAADFFGVEIVVVNSSKKGDPLSSYTPYGVEHPKQAIYLSCLTIGYTDHYNSVQRQPKGSFPTTCKYNYAT